ncbi:SDR family NAD(P)-dependent oxidoreductase [Uruburuella testudinis]|uniref:SDR family NAD(P)-dependent oxidoreductase n=1 Tax=Uruburuella testudinis TaxID=1282863 RepID=A0ABY4DRS5_9NEIS|nr:SDR family NAD(P)-dependent oxidoreductase [Uruburuella testudinis]UOO81307.1 SDR family NAD(P)-dependent oxidoreductase [Uruburuella testudinis]
MNAPDAAILGMGYLGRPLAEKLFEQGSRVAALKRRLTSDDINLPVALDTADLNRVGVFQEAFWQQHWADKPVWICLLPPSALNDYPAVIGGWLALAQQFGVQHIVYAGSISVYGDGERVCDEHSPPQPATAGAVNIMAAEQLLLQSGVPHIDILRLGGLYCAQRHPLTSLLKRSSIAGAHRPVNMLHRGWAVAALYQAACTPGGIRVRNIVEPQHPPKHQFYRAEAAKLGLPEAAFDMADRSGGKTVTTAFDDFTIQAV